VQGGRDPAAEEVAQSKAAHSAVQNGGALLTAEARRCPADESSGATQMQNRTGAGCVGRFTTVCRCEWLMASIS
jgi:hypothetical protein